MVLNSILKSQVLSSISSWFPRSSHLPFRDQLHHPHPFSLLHLWPPYLCVPGPKCRSSHRRKTFHIRIFTLSWFSRRSSHLPVWDQLHHPLPFRLFHQLSLHLCVPGPNCGSKHRRKTYRCFILILQEKQPSSSQRPAPSPSFLPSPPPVIPVSLCFWSSIWLQTQEKLFPYKNSHFISILQENQPSSSPRRAPSPSSLPSPPPVIPASLCSWSWVRS